jgi:general secretion pathway protein J
MTEPTAARRLARRARGRRAFTLLEVMVAIGIVSMVGVLIYGAFMGMSRSRTNMANISDRYQQGRQALERMSRELGSAFLSAHQPFQQTQYTRQTSFIATDSGGGDRVDFVAFANLRLEKDTHESDQCELSFYTAVDSDTGRLDLVRRVAKYIDDKPERGGLVQVLAENVESFNIRYLDAATGEWLDTWDSTQPAAQLGRLPAAVWIVLWLRDGPRGEAVKFETKSTIAIQAPLSFATSN